MQRSLVSNQNNLREEVQMKRNLKALIETEYKYKKESSQQHV
jgi:hypothetical protein